MVSLILGLLSQWLINDFFRYVLLTTKSVKLQEIATNLCSLNFRRFIVWWLFQYRGYVRVKRVCANPLYQLPRRPRKWSRCDGLPPSFAVNAPAVFVPDKAQPCQTSLFVMLISFCCQHFANVARLNSPNRLIKINFYYWH